MTVHLLVIPRTLFSVAKENRKVRALHSRAIISRFAYRKSYCTGNSKALLVWWCWLELVKMGRPEQERSERIRQMQFVKDEIMRIEPSAWNDPLIRRKLMIRLSREWGIRIETVLEYEEYLK